MLGAELGKLLISHRRRRQNRRQEGVVEHQLHGFQSTARLVAAIYNEANQCLN